MPLSAHSHVQAPVPPAGMRWRLDEIDFDAIDRRLVADDPLALRIVLLASFIETGSDLYADNLVEFFAGDDRPMSRRRAQAAAQRRLIRQGLHRKLQSNPCPSRSHAPR